MAPCMHSAYTWGKCLSTTYRTVPSAVQRSSGRESRYSSTVLKPDFPLELLLMARRNCVVGLHVFLPSSRVSKPFFNVVLRWRYEGPERVTLDVQFMSNVAPTELNSNGIWYTT